jgi:hypothetical protein
MKALQRDSPMLDAAIGDTPNPTLGIPRSDIKAPQEINNSPSSIFIDNSGFFYNAAGELLEADWDIETSTYTLQDGNEMVLETYLSICTK